MRAPGQVALARVARVARTAPVNSPGVRDVEDDEPFLAESPLELVALNVAHRPAHDRDLGRDRRPLGEAREPAVDVRVRLERDAEHVASADHPRHERDVGEPERRAREERSVGERRVEVVERRRERLLGAVLLPPERVVGLGEVVVAEDLEPGGGARLGVGGKERRLGVALLEELVDHHRLRQRPAVALEHRHPADGVQLVEPGGPVLEVDHDRLVRDALLGEGDPHAGAVRAARSVDQLQHQRSIR